MVITFTNPLLLDAISANSCRIYTSPFLGSSLEYSKYLPNSPYSASKASADHLVRSWQRTYGLPIIITNCSNNYGPYQNKEKLIPHMIYNAIRGKKLPVYGNGKQIRDWLYVDDHVRALYKVATKGKIGATYNIGGNNEMRNIDLVQHICSLLESNQKELNHLVNLFHL